MAISAELIRIVDYSVNQAIDSTMNTDGPLLSFMNMELIDGKFGTKEFPDGTTDDDLIRVASLPYVQRYVLLTSGKMQTVEPDLSSPLIKSAPSDSLVP